MTRLLWPDLEPEAVESGWLAEVPEKVTTAEVLDALARRHASGDWGGMPGRWAFLREVIAETGQWGNQQRFDAVAVGLVPRVEFAWVVYEVKVSRSDWLRELRPVVEVRDANGYRLRRGREVFGRAQRKVRATDRGKARIVVTNAIQWGRLKKESCVRCGEAKVEAHHHAGYAPENWLAVTWLCRSHHIEAHRAA